MTIADDATIEFRKEERVEFSHIIRSKHIGEYNLDEKRSANVIWCKLSENQLSESVNLPALIDASTCPVV